ncbi:MAG: bifunctional folylpolyglutamate synthase/dihydrofolate synthase [bacterium]
MMLSEVQHFLDSLGMFGWKLGLDTMHSIVEELHEPHQQFKKIHIAGSNGKGSVARMLEAIFIEAGYCVGLYTSPHLVSPLERIRVNGREISTRDFENGIREIKAILEKHKATYFEALTALAFLFFARSKIDIGIIETGLGGRLDATNIIRPDCSIITSISVEHSDYLGRTLQSVAVEKAGIIKKGVPCIIGDLPKAAKQAISQKCAEMKSMMIVAGEVISANINNEDISGTDVIFSVEENDFVAKLRLAGNHQVENAKVAIASSMLFENVNTIARIIPKALPRVQFPGRMQIMSRKPVVILDVAHNPESISALFKSIMKFFPGRKINLVLGILKDKDIESILQIFKKNPVRIWCVTPVSDRALEGQTLHASALSLGIDSKYVPTISTSIKQAIQCAGRQGVVVVTGSHYVVGENLGCISEQ